MLTGVLQRAQASIGDIVRPLREQNPHVPQEVWENFAARVTDPTVLTPMYSAIYRRHVSPPDIRALVRFYGSPLGQRYVAASMRIDKDANVAVVEWARRIAADFLANSAGDDMSASVADQEAKITPDQEAKITPNSDESIQEFMVASGVRQQAHFVSTMMLDRLKRAAPGDDILSRATARLADGTALMQLWIPIYRHNLDPRDIEDLIAFYRTPVGRRWSAQTEPIEQEAFVAARQRGEEAAKRAIREVLGPLPQWRLMHPSSPSTAPGNR